MQRWQRGDLLKRCVQAAAERAAEAAAEAVGGGLEGPAANAARQAAQMGASALSTALGMEQIGGFQAQIAELERVVIVPLKVKSQLA